MKSNPSDAGFIYLLNDDFAIIIIIIISKFEAGYFK